MARVVPVKHYYGGSIDPLYIHPSYPVYSSNAGSMIGVLDAVLVNGFAEVTVSSLVIDASGIATATSTAHGYNKIHTPIAISGADQTPINGEWEISGFTANTITFNAAAANLPNTTITGATIKLKIPPLGWQKVFYDAGNSIAVYRSADPLSRRHFLRVDDADNAAVTYRFTYFRGYESMGSADDSGSYGFPLKSSFSRGVGVNKTIHTLPRALYNNQCSQYLLDYHWNIQAILSERRMCLWN